MNGGNSNGMIGGLIALCIVGGGGAAYYFYTHNKKADPVPPSQDKKFDAPGPGRDRDRDRKDDHFIQRPTKSGPTPGPLAKKVGADEVVDVPFIFWGGDVATFHANGGLDTTADSLFGKHGIKCKLTPGDNFEEQVKNYKEGKTPFLRGTLSMLGQVSDDLTAKEATVPVVFLQLTWSAGDHLVGRQQLKQLQDLRGKTIALQEGGPHVGMLNDILRTTRMDWKDINVKWTKDVSGKDGPAELFRKDPSVDACFAITPDMIELTSAPDTGGIEATGDGTKNSVKGAHVVVSTAHMSRSIADVYACRSDFYDANREWIDKFVAGYLKGCEELVDVKRKAEGKDKVAEERYKKDIKLAQSIWGKDPALKDQVAKDEDVDGLISDAVFVGVPGNETFFKQRGNLSGFDFKQKQALKLPADPSKEPLKNDVKLFEAADLDYNALRRLGDLHGRAPSQARILAEPKIEPETTIFSFQITFEPDQSDFPAEKYGNDFQRALEIASLFGNTALAVRGHADPCLLVQVFLESGKARGIIRMKPGGNYVSAVGNIEFNPTNPQDIKKILDIISKNPGMTYRDPRAFRDFPISGLVQNLDSLSNRRAEEVRKTVVNFATSKNLVLDAKQFRAKGEGVLYPVRIDIQPQQPVDENRRVNFSIIKVPQKDLNTNEFDL
jgi:ABC-type nitrate/sulfonate/bicarbonate transport system substrate-binding protein